MCWCFGGVERQLEWGLKGVAENASLSRQLLGVYRIEQPNSFRWNTQSSH